MYEHTSYCLTLLVVAVRKQGEGPLKRKDQWYRWASVATATKVVNLISRTIANKFVDDERNLARGKTCYNENNNNTM